MPPSKPFLYLLKIVLITTGYILLVFFIFKKYYEFNNPPGIFRLNTLFEGIEYLIYSIDIFLSILLGYLLVKLYQANKTISNFRGYLYSSIYVAILLLYFMLSDYIP